jgi:RHS repeat-associated protein
LKANTLILQYKYNSKELLETGMYSYGWRDYMPDIARWNGIDQLAEAYSSTSTYAYVANNPVLMTDPDGRWMDDSGHITDTTGQTFGFLGSSYKPQGATNYLGVKYGDGGGNGSYTPFGRTQAYADLMTAFYNGGTGGMSNIGGTLRWWTDYEDPDPTVTGIGVLGILKLKGYSDNIDFGKTTSSATWWVNTAVSTASTANLPRTGFFKYNELWHQTKTRGVSFAWQNKWKNPGAKFWRGQQVKGFQGARSLGDKLTKAGAVLLVADIAMSGEIKPSHAINAFMLGVSTTGVGSIVAGIWFVADVGTMGVNFLMNGQAKGLGDMIDESVANDYGKIELYDGLY